MFVDVFVSSADAVFIFVFLSKMSNCLNSISILVICIMLLPSVLVKICFELIVQTKFLRLC